MEVSGSDGGDAHWSHKQGWSLYFPVHMPGLELSQSLEDGEDIDIDETRCSLIDPAGGAETE